jgi:protein-S-isoprenylcysteine O-methyltransferase Ste14
MLLLRALLFTILVPGMVGGYLPYVIVQRWPDQFDFGIVHSVGLLLIAVGLLLYGICTFLFLTKGRGTPTIWFTRPFRAILGEEPRMLVSHGLYQRTRNPMYLGVTLLVFGEALWFANVALCVYTVALWIFFHGVVVFIEEPHLKARGGQQYAMYCSKVPRWFGFRKLLPAHTHKA